MYMINRSPTASIDFKSPEEVWLGKQPGYKHMRQFGSVVYIYADQGKLKPRASKEIFIGYPAGTKGYKVWMLEDEKCVVSRNVKFQVEMVYKYMQDKGERKENQGGGGVIVTPLVRESDVEDGGSEVDDNVSSSKTKSDGSNEVEAHHELTGSSSHKESLTNYQLARDRQRRVVVPPVKYNDYDCDEEEVAFALMVSVTMYAEEPKSMSEAKSSSE